VLPYRPDAMRSNLGYEPKRGVCAEGYVCRTLPARNRTVMLWGVNGEEFRANRWPGGEGGVASVRRNCGVLSFLVGLKGVLGCLCQRGVQVSACGHD